MTALTCTSSSGATRAWYSGSTTIPTKSPIESNHWIATPSKLNKGEQLTLIINAASRLLIWSMARSARSAPAAVATEPAETAA